MQTQQIDFNTFNWNSQRDDRYTCKHCNKPLLFYHDQYVCNQCGTLYRQIESFGDPYKPPNWDRYVRFIQTTYVIEDIPAGAKQSNNKSKISIDEKINQIFTERNLDKSIQTELWRMIGKVSVAGYLKEKGFKYKYIDSDAAWRDLYIFKKVG